MDFWEVLKVLGRRWVVTVPLVVLAVTAALLIPPRIAPSYTASASVVVITPIVEDIATNPFLVLGAVTMASSLSISADSAGSVAQVTAAGGSPSFTVDQQNARSPILVVTAEADTPELAADTTRLALDQMQTQLSEQQDRAGAAPDAQFYLEDLTGEVAASPVFTGAQRVRFLALGIGIALAVSLALTLEGISVLRARRRTAAVSDRRPTTTEERLALLDERERLLVERERLLAEQDREQDEEQESHGRVVGAPGPRQG